MDTQKMQTRIFKCRRTLYLSSFKVNIRFYSMILIEISISTWLTITTVIPTERLGVPLNNTFVIRGAHYFKESIVIFEIWIIISDVWFQIFLSSHSTLILTEMNQNDPIPTVGNRIINYWQHTYVITW